LIKPSANKISVVSFKIGSKPVTAKMNITRNKYCTKLDLGFSQQWPWTLWVLGCNTAQFWESPTAGCYNAEDRTLPILHWFSC
jgi:hypothetical protein